MSDGVSDLAGEEMFTGQRDMRPAYRYPLTSALRLFQSSLGMASSSLSIPKKRVTSRKLEVIVARKRGIGKRTKPPFVRKEAVQNQLKLTQVK